MTMKSFDGKREEYKLPDAWAGIEARPLISMDVIDQIRPKSSSLELRWVNRVAGDFLRYNQMVAAGFVPAKPEELVMRTGNRPIPVSMVKEGKVIYGDIIAMLIDKNLYQGALKHNALRAIELGDRLRLKDTVAPQVRHDLTSKLPSDLARKITTFVPTEAEVDRISEKNEKEGQKLG